MTVFHIISSIHQGGSENVVFSLCEYNVRNKSDVNMTIFELFKTENKYAQDKKEQLRKTGIKFYTLGNKSKHLSLLIAPFTLLYYLIKLQPSFVHSHTDLPDFVVSLTLRLNKITWRKPIKLVRTIHNTELWPTHHFIGRITEAAFQNDQIIAVSNSALTAYQNLRNKNNLKASLNQYVIHNSILISPPTQFPVQLDKTKINFLFAGRLELQKGTDVLIDSLRRLPKTISEKTVFHLVGNGSYKPQIELLSKELNNCISYDAIPNLSNKISEFDYILMPSRHEGLALTSLEASFSKVPVIATNVPGLIETLPPKWPLIMETVSAEEIIKKIEFVIQAGSTLNYLKEQTYTYVTTYFSFEKMASEYLFVYRNAKNK